MLPTRAKNARFYRRRHELHEAVTYDVTKARTSIIKHLPRCRVDVAENVETSNDTEETTFFHECSGRNTDKQEGP